MEPPTTEPKAVREDIGAQETIREVQDRRVPDDIVRELHEANGRADALRQRLEAALGDNELGKAERTQQIGDQLREAEREIEEISAKVRDASPPEAKGG